ncbi:hypothetical protein [Bdellovibrio bacteriovorus]|uniref:hypothetical protein n=1 Tax=Bdellovibrio bacteriovorus TaxID=959 RepID=UPI0035A630A8
MNREEKKVIELVKKREELLSLYANFWEECAGGCDDSYGWIVSEWIEASLSGNLTRLFARQLLLSAYPPFLKDFENAKVGDLDQLANRWGGDFITGKFRPRTFGYREKSYDEEQGKLREFSDYYTPTDLILNPAILVLNDGFLVDGEFNATEADFESPKSFADLDAKEFDLAQDPNRLLCLINLERSIDEIIHSIRNIRSEYVKRRPKPIGGLRGLDIDDADLMLFIASINGMPMDKVARVLATSLRASDTDYHALVEERNRKRLPELLAFVDPYSKLPAENSPFG